MNFGEKIRDLRTQKKLTQVELAKALGLSLRTILNYESGDVFPKKREIYFKMSDLFGVDVNYLLTENEEFLLEATAKYGLRGRVQAEDVLAQVSALFAGGELSEDERLAFVHEIQELYFDSKERTREKFTPKKYQKDGE